MEPEVFITQRPMTGSCLWQMHSVHTLTYFFKSHCSIISSTLGSCLRFFKHEFCMRFFFYLSDTKSVSLNPLEYSHALRRQNNSLSPPLCHSSHFPVVCPKHARVADLPTVFWSHVSVPPPPQSPSNEIKSRHSWPVTQRT
jgi:hypothetical protein